jgi:hypothetical protein
MLATPKSLGSNDLAEVRAGSPPGLVTVVGVDASRAPLQRPGARP